MIKKTGLLILSVISLVLLIGCTNKNTTISITEANPKNDTYYEVFVRSFADSDGDGVGDFKGIEDNLGYFTELGITALWLMPINPASSYHGYDVTDYYDVSADYGTMDDFESLVQSADDLGIKIVLDMVFNHTSNQHPWFLAAINGDEYYQQFYTFVDINTNTTKVLGSWGQNIWHTINDYKYCGYFSNTMPDLNFYNDEVKNEILKITQFWIDKGVSGFRLDAVHHYYGDNESLTMDNNYLDNIMYLKQYEEEVQQMDPDFYLLGEVYVEDLYTVVGDYFGAIDSPIDFPVAAKIRSSVSSYSNESYTTFLKRYYDYYRSINEDFISAPFIVNHDMDRLASLTNGNTITMKLAAEMLLTLPGNPIIYYGEEIGMYGYKANGPDIWDETRRMSFIWGNDFTTDWINSSNAAYLDLDRINHLIASATVQKEDDNSLYSTYQELIQLRNQNIALKYGNSFELYEGNTSSIQGFYRSYSYNEDEQTILVLHNFSNQAVSFDVEGTILYVSNVKDYSGIDSIPARGTIMIDVSGQTNE